MTEPVSPYQYHISRLTAEVQNLRGQLKRTEETHRAVARRLRAERDEGVSPKLRALENKNRQLAAENSKMHRELRELRGGRPNGLENVRVPEAVRGLPQVQASSEQTGKAFKKAKDLLRHIGVLLSAAEDNVRFLRQHEDDVVLAGLAELAELAELRREELLQLAAMMREIPASVAHRGTGAYRPVPPGRGVL